VSGIGSWSVKTSPAARAYFERPLLGRPADPPGGHREGRRRPQGDLVVEQNVARALAVADDAHVLERGRLVASGRAADHLRSNLVQATYLGAR
jgi:hypothetical protein